MTSKKSEMEPIEIGNSVTIPIHKRGNPTDKNIVAFIQVQINKWKGTNPLKHIVGNTETIFVPASGGRASSISSIKFVWEPLYIRGFVTDRNYVINKCGTITFVIRSNSYRTNFSWFKSLLEIARTDFPFLTEDLVVIKIYNTDCHKGHTGIEFTLPEGTSIPKNYTQISQLEQAF